MKEIHERSEKLFTIVLNSKTGIHNPIFNFFMTYC